MQALDQAQYQTLREGAEVLEADGSGDKVLRLLDGSILKLFRRKRLISSAAWYPYAQRFADNCETLACRGVPCPRIHAIYRVGEIARDAVHYDPLPGRTLRQLLLQGDEDDSLLYRFGHFLAELHQQGIYFRSVHLGNVVLTPENHLGLIDVADMRTYRSPLSRPMRLRNFKHLLRYESDRDWLLQNCGSLFLTAYLNNQTACTASDLSTVVR